MKIKIIQWDKLKSIYGVTAWNAIKVRFLFTEYMEDSLPDDRIIDVNKKGQFYEWVTIRDGVDIYHELSEDIIEGIVND